MNLKIGTEAPQFPEMEYLNGIFGAVRGQVGGGWALEIETFWAL
jgi:hypothetical protein